MMSSWFAKLFELLLTIEHILAIIRREHHVEVEVGSPNCEQVGRFFEPEKTDRYYRSYRLVYR
jgi:hypothetical protein